MEPGRNTVCNKCTKHNVHLAVREDCLGFCQHHFDLSVAMEKDLWTSLGLTLFLWTKDKVLKLLLNIILFVDKDKCSHRGKTIQRKRLKYICPCKPMGRPS